jgi:UDP-N-acetylmuramoyl-tripeptide--D-alanyl-D-alanine ligase
MEAMTLEEIKILSGGELDARAESRKADRVARVSTDSRTVREGDLFVALKGERFNAHEFLGQVEENRATAALVSRSQLASAKSQKLPLVLVEDSLQGLQSLAANYRRKCSALRTVVVAGSNGKTGTKDMVAAVLGERHRIQKTSGNLNNHIGVPLTLLSMDSSHEIGVLEIGTNHPGELRPLLEMIRPHAGVITNIGEEHLEFFKDLEGVAREEGTTAEFIPDEGLIALNAGDPWSESIAKRARCKIAWFGFGERAEYRAADIELRVEGTRFRMITPIGETTVQLKLLGRHQVTNALAAAALAQFYGITLDQIRQGLEKLAPSKMRMELKKSKSGVAVINDAYNANPASMRAALETFQELRTTGAKLAVLGAMRELGESAAGAHLEIGKQAAEAGLTRLYVVGDDARGILDGAAGAGFGANAEFFPNVEALVPRLRQQVKSGDLVLLKASRGVSLERALEAFEF